MKNDNQTPIEKIDNAKFSAESNYTDFKPKRTVEKKVVNCQRYYSKRAKEIKC